MSSSDEVTTPAWVPDECTLPTAQRQLRLAEFDDLIATALRSQQRPEPTRLRWQLDPAAETTARDLAARESTCCSFFTFSFTRPRGGGESVQLQVDVSARHVDILDALAARAAAGMAV